MNTILYASPFHHAVSGADESLLTLLQFLPKDRWRAVVVLPWRSAHRARYQELSARVIRFPMFRIIRSYNPIYWIWFLFWFPIETLFFMIHIMKERPCLVHSNMDSLISPLVAAKLLRVPSILHYRAKTVDEPKWFFDRFLPLLHCLSERIVAISRATAQPFFKRNLGAKVDVVYNGVDLSRFRKLQHGRLAEILPWSSGKKIALFVGRIDPQKRLEDLIAAAGSIVAKIPEIAFIIVGGDPNVSVEYEHRAFLEAQVSKLQLEPYVHFLGRRSDIPELLASSDCFIFPAENEGFGRAIIEAMAAGVPVIAANSGAPPELLQDGRLGILIPPRNPDALAKAVVEVFHSSAARERATLAKEVAFEQFGAREHAEKIEVIYEKLISKTEKPAC